MIKQNSASIRQFVKSDLNIIKELINSTIDKCYGNVYTEEAIHFFKNFHAPENILNDANRGFTLVMMRQGHIMGTGTLIGDHVYVFSFFPVSKNAAMARRLWIFWKG